MASYFRMTTVFLVFLLGLAMVVMSSGSDPATTGSDASAKRILQILLALRHPQSGPLDKRQNEGQDEAALKDACGMHWAIPVGGERLSIAEYFQKIAELSQKYNLLELATLGPEELAKRAPWGFVEEISGITCVTATNDTSVFGLDFNCDAGRCVCGDIPPPCPRPLPDVNIAECEAKLTEEIESLGNNQNSADRKLAGNRAWLLSFVVFLFKN